MDILNFSDIGELLIDNKEIRSLTDSEGNVLFYSNRISLEVTGNNFSTYNNPFTFKGSLTINWGDNSYEAYNGGQLTHTYNDGNNIHTVNIYGNIIALNDNCFADCTGLTSITLPDSITTLSDYCFYGCTNLTTVKLSNNITELKDSCFRNCTGLSSIEIPDSVTKIERLCFSNCISLTSIEIPDNVTNVVRLSFEHCTNLTTVICNWTTSPPFYLDWFDNPLPIFSIPQGTKTIYEGYRYPTEKLVERNN